MGCSMPGFSVLHYLLEFAQIIMPVPKLCPLLWHGEFLEWLKLRKSRGHVISELLTSFNEMELPTETLKMVQPWDFSGGPVVKNTPSIGGDMFLIPGWEAKITHAVGQLSLHTETTEPTCSRAHVPQQSSCMLQLR